MWSGSRIVAVEIYTGNHPSGKNQVLKGDNTLAWAADEFASTHPIETSPDLYEDVIQSITPGEARVRGGQQGFTIVRAYRVVDAEKVLAWAQKNRPDMFNLPLKAIAEIIGVSYSNLRRAARLPEDNPARLPTTKYSERSQVANLVDAQEWKAAHYKPQMKR